MYSHVFRFLKEVHLSKWYKYVTKSTLNAIFFENQFSFAVTDDDRLVAQMLSYLEMTDG